MNYILHILIVIFIYLILTLSLNLLVGYLGILSLSHAAFYGIGAYTTVLLMMQLNLSFIQSVCLSFTFTVALSFIVSLSSLKLKGDFFILASLGFQIIVFELLYNLVPLTNGPFGISEIPRPSILGLHISSVTSYCVFSGIIALICSCLLYLITSSPFGRVLKSIREDEIATETLGKNTFHFKATTFALAAGFASVAGSLFAGYMGYIDPTSFTLGESIFILSLIIIGGAGNFSGPIIGTAFMVVIPEILRLVYIPDAVAANVKQIIFGLLIIIFMRYRPNGLLGEYRFK